MRRANGSTTMPAQSATMAADFEEQTEPESHVVITNATLHRLMLRLSARVSWLAAAVLVNALAVFLFGLFLYWSRPR